MKYFHSCGFGLAVMFALGNGVPALTQSSKEHLASWRTLDCHGTTQKTIGLGDSTSTNERSSDEMTIVRKGNLLVVTVNGKEAKKRFGREDFFSDTYKITRASGHGLTATHSSSTDLVVHTLVVNNAGKSALWSESGIFLLEPYKPFISIIVFDCTK